MMTDGKDLKMFGGANYLEIARERIVYTQHFTDEDGSMSRHPMAPLWPEKMLTVVTLAAEGPDQTRVTVEWEPYGNFTSEEVAAFVKEKSGMMMGWGGSFDKLEAHLAQ